MFYPIKKVVSFMCLSLSPNWARPGQPILFPWNQSTQSPTFRTDFHPPAMYAARTYGSWRKAENPIDAYRCGEDKLRGYSIVRAEYCTIYTPYLSRHSRHRFSGICRWIRISCLSNTVSTRSAKKVLQQLLWRYSMVCVAILSSSPEYSYMSCVSDDHGWNPPNEISCGYTMCYVS